MYFGVVELWCVKTTAEGNLQTEVSSLWLGTMHVCRMNKLLIGFSERRVDRFVFLSNFPGKVPNLGPHDLCSHILPSSLFTK